jgi:hypothetical protein
MRRCLMCSSKPPGPGRVAHHTDSVWAEMPAATDSTRPQQRFQPPIAGTGEQRTFEGNHHCSSLTEHGYSPPPGSRATTKGYAAAVVRVSVCVCSQAMASYAR